MSHLAIAAVHVASCVIPAARPLNRWTKPLLMPSLALSRPEAPAIAKFSLAASTFGDIALMRHSPAGTMAGMAGFGVAHLAFVVGLARRGRAATPATTCTLTAGWLAAVTGAAVILQRALRDHPDRALTGPVIGYAALCSAMAAAAIRAGITVGGPAGRQLISGGLWFVLSDSLVAAALFGPPEWDRTGRLSAVIMATYVAAQANLVDGISSS